MANNLGRFLLSSLLGGGQLRDYAHAAQTFRSNGFDRAGKTKYLFQAVFNINKSATQLQIPLRELSVLVKKIELPKYTIEAREMNQYNRKQLNYTKIKYNPINITFHDDNGNQIRELWRSYYNYYFSDGRYDPSAYNYNDKYSERINNAWGLDAGSTAPFFTSIDIYSMHAGEAMEISLMNPMITSFGHDTHDYANGGDLMEHQMQITYTSVKYQNGYWNAVPGFGDSPLYDSTPSDLAGSYAGYQVDPSSGSIFQGSPIMNDPYMDQNVDPDFARSQQVFEQINVDNKPISTLNTVDINNILQNQTSDRFTGCVFPNATYNYGIGSTTPFYGSIDIGSTIQATSENNILPDNKQYLGVYEQGTWQRALEEKGNDVRDIAAAETAVTQAVADGVVANNADAQQFATRFIDNVNSVRAITDPKLTTPADNYLVTIADVQTIQPVYNSGSWQTSLTDKGYTDSEIAKVENALVNVNLSPSIDVAVWAERYISTTADSTTA
jgi:hypothetical protein